MANDLATTGPKTYGGLQPSGSLGADEFAAHDASKSWQDAGQAEALQLSLVPEIAAYGAQQAKEAVLEYTSKAWADIAAVQGEVCVLLDFSNDLAPYAQFWKLGDLMAKAVAEAENAGDEMTLKAIGRFLEQMNRIFRSPVAEPARAASRALRPGATRPAIRTQAAGRVSRRPGGDAEAR